MDAVSKPRPRVTPDNRPFWDGCRQHRLLLPWCTACSVAFLPPSPVCPHCLGESIEWRAASGRATVSSFVVVHQKWFPAFDADIPYNVVQVELEEGPRLTSALVGVQEADIRVGMPVTVVFEDLDEHTTLPRFRRRG
jgi:uncharacterized OB-fold protein